MIEFSGCSWYIKELVLCYFFEKEWFNIIVMFKKDGIYYYCNVLSFYVYDLEVIKYIDYDLDIRVYLNGCIVVLDCKEFEINSSKLNYLEDIIKIVNYVIIEFKVWIKEKCLLFDDVIVKLNLEIFKKVLDYYKELKEIKNIERNRKRDK